jgi:hypothetical protein
MIRRVSRAALFASATLILFASSGSAQRPSAISRADTLEIELIAATRAGVLTRDKSAVFVDDVFFGESQKFAPVWRSEAHKSSLALALGAVRTNQEVRVECGKRPESCRMIGARSIVSIGAPKIAGDTATISVTWQDYNPQLVRQPVNYGATEVLVVRAETGWRFLRFGMMSAS